MSKHRYHRTGIKDIDWKQVSDAVGQGRTVFAIDVAKEDFVAALMKPDKSVIVTVKWRHPEETRDMVDALICHVEAEHLEVVLEPSGTYGDPVRRLFSGLGVRTYMASPKRVHDAAEVYDGVPSLHDAKAAYLIGRLHLDGSSRLWQELPIVRRDLKAAVALMELYQRQYQSDLNRLEGLLARHWPEALGIMDRGAISLLSLLKNYGSPAQMVGDRNAAERLMHHVGRGFLKPEKVEKLLASAESTLGLACSPLEVSYLKGVARDALRAHREAREAQKIVEQKVVEEPLTQPLVPVVGKVTSAVLIANQGAPQNYPNAGSYLKGLGLNLKEHSSGKHQGQLGITKRGSGISRHYLYFATLRFINHDPVVQAWYYRKVRRDGNLKSKAVIAVMRKLAQALWHLGQGEAFDSRRLFNPGHLGLTA